MISCQMTTMLIIGYGTFILIAVFLSFSQVCRQLILFKSNANLREPRVGTQKHFSASYKSLSHSQKAPSSKRRSKSSTTLQTSISVLSLKKREVAKMTPKNKLWDAHLSLVSPKTLEERAPNNKITLQKRHDPRNKSSPTLFRHGERIYQHLLSIS